NNVPISSVTISKQILCMVFPFFGGFIHNVFLAVDNHLADDLGHCVQGLLVRIDQTMLDEFVALVVKNINVEFGVSRLAEQKSPQERNRDVAVGAALPHNILARILFDRAVPSVLSCGRIRGWSPPEGRLLQERLLSISCCPLQLQLLRRNKPMQRLPLFWKAIAASVAGSFPRLLKKKSPPKLGFERELVSVVLSNRGFGCKAQYVPSIAGLHDCANAGAQNATMTTNTRAIRDTLAPQRDEPLQLRIFPSRISIVESPRPRKAARDGANFRNAGSKVDQVGVLAGSCGAHISALPTSVPLHTLRSIYNLIDEILTELETFGSPMFCRDTEKSV